MEIDYLKTELAPRTASLAAGYDAVCGFVNSDVGGETLRTLAEQGVKLVLMRCAGFNNVDLKCAGQQGITVMRVPTQRSTVGGGTRHGPGSGSQPEASQSLCKGAGK